MEDLNNQNYSNQPATVDNKSIKNLKILLTASTFLLILVTLTLVYLLTEFKNLKNTRDINPISEIKNETTPTKTIQSDNEQIKSLICKRIGGCNESSTVSIDKVSGIFATGTSGGAQGGGAHWWTVKIDGTWKIVWETQDAMACQISDKYNIPVEMYAIDDEIVDCYSEYPQSEINKFINGLEL